MHLRLVLNTALYIASVAAVIAAAINPVGTSALLRRQSVRLVAAVRTLSSSAHEPVVTAAEIKGRPSPAQATPRGAGTGEYRIAIGTPIPARLRTPIDSSTARVNDQVDAILTTAITQDGVELIPAGSALHGRIVQADAATKKTPLGRIEMVFTVVQHADTRSRAAIHTHSFTAEADAPREIPGGRTPKRQPIDVALAAGHPIVLTLSEPLLVYIPNAR